MQLPIKLAKYCGKHSGNLPHTGSCNAGMENPRVLFHRFKETKAKPSKVTTD